MKQIATYINFIVMLLLVSCSSSDDFDNRPSLLPSDDTWVEEILDGSSVTIKPFLPGDAISRSSLAFDGQNLVFGWNKGDKVGLYPTAKDKEKAESTEGLLDPQTEANRHVSYTSENQIWRTDPEVSPQSKFEVVIDPKEGSQTVRIDNDNPDFKWDEIVRWSAYYPYSVDDIDKGSNPIKESYVSRSFDFTNQVQNGLVNISAYKKGDNTNYRNSELTACAHLGNKDVMISPEMKWNGSRINFQMRHVGAVVRLYLLAPKENLVIKDVKLICETPIFYEKGKFTLISHPYVDDPDQNYGVDLNRESPGCQIKAIPEEPPTNKLELKFADGSAKTEYDANDSYKRYITAYIMTYPIKYNPTDNGELYAYVTAYKQGDTADKEYHFVSKALALEGINMKSGYYYQWTSSTHVDDGLYPIELTATLKPWQEIVGASIDLDLEK